MKRQLSRTVVALFTLQIILATTLNSQDDFEEFQKKQQQAFENYLEEDQEAYEQYKRDVEQKWREFLESSVEEWVTYGEDKDTKNAIRRPWKRPSRRSSNRCRTSFQRRTRPEARS